jgi:hypothetical protein
MSLQADGKSNDSASGYDSDTKPMETTDDTEEMDNKEAFSQVQLKIEVDSDLDPLDEPEDVEDTNNILPPSPSPSSPPPKRFKQSKVVKTKDLKSALNRITNIANNLTRVTNNVVQGDQFDGFGKYVAATLRSLNLNTAIMAMSSVQKTLGDIQLRAVREGHTI